MNNLDDLLYQLYINLDSDCLFTMPLEELAKAWGLSMICNLNKPYESEKDAFCIEGFHNKQTGVNDKIVIGMTYTYREKRKTLFPEGNLPRLIPSPFIVFRGKGIPGYNRYIGPGAYIFYKNFEYYWLNSDYTRSIIMNGNYGDMVDSISINNYLNPFYLPQEAQ